MVKICPRCGSKDVFVPTGRSTVSPFNVCRNCNFYGVLFPEVDKKTADEMDRKSANFPRYYGKSRKAGPVMKLVVIAVVLSIFLAFAWLIFSSY